MKKQTIVFFAVKFIVFQIVNLIAFGAAYLIDTLSGFFFTVDQAFAQTALVCLCSFAIFLGYLFFTTAAMKESRLSPALFVIREAAAYMLFMIIPTVGALSFGTDAIGRVPLLRFYLPNLAGAHLTGMPIIGFFLQSMLVTAMVYAAHIRNCKRHEKARAQEERNRAEDEAYAEKLINKNTEDF